MFKKNNEKISWVLISRALKTRTTNQCSAKYNQLINPDDTGAEIRPLIMWGRNDEVELLNL